MKQSTKKIYTHCVKCGVAKQNHQMRSPRCRACGSIQAGKNRTRKYRANLKKMQNVYPNVTPIKDLVFAKQRDEVIVALDMLKEALVRFRA